MAGAALAAVAVGLLVGEVAVFLAAVVPIAYAAYAGATTAPEPRVEIERSIEDVLAIPGRPVTVTVTATNVGERTMVDLRLIDHVPAGLSIVSGRPRFGTALAPGDSASFEYVIRGRRGIHEFETVTAIVRDASGASVRRDSLPVETTFRCSAPVEKLPLRNQTALRVGQQTTDEGGSGTEFHSLREYRAGDSMKRIAWSRLAKTGDLSTVEYREQRAAAIVVVVDVREDAAVAASSDELSGVEYGAYAAERAFATLLAEGHTVGLAAVPTEPTLLRPAAGADQHARGIAHFERGVTFSPPETPKSTAAALRTFLGFLPGHAQVIFCTPVCDDGAVDIARQMQAYGHLVTVVSPDVTGGSTPGQQVVRIERRERMRRLRSLGVRVVDWDPGEPLAVAVDRAARGWIR